MRLEFATLVLAGFGLGAAISIGYWSTAYDKQVHRIGDCAYSKWEEYETRTGSIPTRELEQSWWSECAGGSNAQ